MKLLRGGEDDGLFIRFIRTVGGVGVNVGPSVVAAVVVYGDHLLVLLVVVDVDAAAGVAYTGAWGDA